MDKQKAVKHFLDLGYDAEIKDGVLYVNYDNVHDPEELREFVGSEIRRIGYNNSYGVKANQSRARVLQNAGSKEFYTEEE